MLALGIGATTELALDAIGNRAVARKVMGIGRGLFPVTNRDGSISYETTAETIRRADEMGRYYRAHTAQADAGRLAMLLCSGGFPEKASRGKIVRPPEGINEATMQDERLEKVWRVPKEIRKTEGISGSTFDNFIQSIKAGHLVPHEFDPDNPLVISASECHAWRIAPIAQQSLALPPGSLLRLRDGNLENGLATRLQERVGYSLTRLALAEVGAEPGNLEHTQEASQLFHEWAQTDMAAIGKLGRSLGALASLLIMPDVPLAAY